MFQKYEYFPRQTNYFCSNLWQWANLRERNFNFVFFCVILRSDNPKVHRLGGALYKFSICDEGEIFDGGLDGFAYSRFGRWREVCGFAARIFGVDVRVGRFPAAADAPL